MGEREETEKKRKNKIFGYNNIVIYIKIYINLYIINFQLNIENGKN